MGVAFLAISAVCAIDAKSLFRDPTADMVLTEDQLAQYGGILDLIPGVGDLIQKLTPIIQAKIGVLLDPNIPQNEKIQQIMEVCKEHAGEIVQIFGDFGLKIIIQQILPGIIAGSMGR